MMVMVMMEQRRGCTHTILCLFVFVVLFSIGWLLQIVGEKEGKGRDVMARE